MASAELMRLHKLHLIDAAILEIKKRASAMEEGQKLKATAEIAKAAFENANKAYHEAHGEQVDLELANQQIADKIKAIDKQVFSGSTVNPKEIEAFEHQKKGLMKNQSANDEKLLELYETVPPLKSKAEEMKKKAEKVIAEFTDWRTRAASAKVELEEKFKGLSAKRPEIAKTITPGLLARYDAIRVKNQVGMADVTAEKTCEECGTSLPEMAMVQLLDDRTVQCEGCSRILYYTGGVI